MLLAIMDFSRAKAVKCKCWKQGAFCLNESMEGKLLYILWEAWRLVGVEDLKRIFYGDCGKEENAEYTKDIASSKPYLLDFKY